MSLIIPQELVYASPSKGIEVEGNYVEFTPISGTSFSANENIRINISSSTHFLDYQRSYLKYDLLITDTSASTCSYLGGTSPLYRVSEQLGGLQVSDIPSYNVLCALQNLTYPTTKQNLLKAMEGYTLVGGFGVTDSVSSTWGRKVVHSMRTPVSGIKQHIPLPYASYQLDITLDTLANVVKNASGSAYTVKNVRFVAYLVKPSPEYLQQVQNAFSQGSTMKLPIEQIRSFQSRPVAVKQQSLLFNIGVCDSVRSFVQSQRLTASVNSTSTDSFNTFTNNALESYFFNISGMRVPSNFAVNCNNKVGNANYSISTEQAMILLASVDNDYSALSFPQNTDSTSSNGVSNTGQFIFYPFSTSRAFGTGTATKDGVIDCQLSFESAPASTEVVNTFISMDAIIEISNSSVYIRYTNL